MDNVFYSEIIKVVFNKISTHQVIAQNCMCTFDTQEISRLLQTEMPNQHYPALTCRVDALIHNLNSSHNKIEIFSLLFEFVKRIIVYENYCFEFRFEMADVWRSTVVDIDEEFLVCTAAAIHDADRNFTRSEFDWMYSIEHNNFKLKSILNRDIGVSENHFHLRGSTPYFNLSWIRLMNHVGNEGYRREIIALDESRLKSRKIRNISEYDSSYLLLYLRAAAIRLYLYSTITQYPIMFYDYQIPIMKAKYELESMGISFQKVLQELYGNDTQEDMFIACHSFINLNDIKRFYVRSKTLYQCYIEHCLNQSYHYLMSILHSEDTSLFSIVQLQKIINGLHFSGYNRQIIDYAQIFPGNFSQKYQDLAGERYILYHSFKSIYEEKKFKNSLQGLLYIYLLIKNKIRSELVQSNDFIGFDNFLNYQNRKDWFIPEADFYEKKLATATIQSLLDGPKIHYSELRISPNTSWIKMRNRIELYDQAIQTAISSMNLSDKITIDKFFYTLHFTKREENSKDKQQCRHHSLRYKVACQTSAIIQLRKFNSRIADRILGIDACGAEMNCRPEVFATAFRQLQYYNEPKANSVFRFPHARQLKTTYHVGEDNYDIVDALRAIQEAVLFLNLRHGARLGHATLLGIPASKFYEKKSYIISMPSQNFLDNIVWLYTMIENQSLQGSDLTKTKLYLEEKFDEYFRKIYLENLPDAYIDPNGIQKHLYYNIHRYYDSWLLRGDEPTLYKKGVFHNPSIFEHFKICDSDTRMKSARETPEAVYLYYSYHYNESVRNEGKIGTTELIPDYLIGVIESIQNLMQAQLAQLGIGIETNPSSNVFISSFDNYDEHPITNFYNKELSGTTKMFQSNISINTDDKSVFSTCLSNEYAYLLFYLQRKKDAAGKLLYSDYELYDWIDSIRKMGNDQSFGNKC